MHKFLVKTMAGLEQVLEKELQDLGAENIQVLKRSVMCEGDNELMYRINYHCRTALRVLKQLGTFNISNQADLYDAVSSINWLEHLSPQDTLAIDSVVSNAPNFNNNMFVSVKAKDAIVDQLRKKTGERPSIDNYRPTLRINIHIHRFDCTVSLDSSGDSLHKRGYRMEEDRAPINEVLAAGLIMLTGWNTESPFINPMCGSGTFLCEAGLMARRIPPGYFKNEFAFQLWRDFDKSLWKSIVDKAQDEIIDSKIELSGFDISKISVDKARKNARMARLGELAKIDKVDFFKSSLEPKSSTVLINPPYGERLNEEENLNKFYKDMSDVLKQNYKGNTCWIISSNLEALKHFGLRPTRKITVFNGPLECKFLKFDLY